MANTMRKNTDARARDGVARSSDESLVTRAERRARAVDFTSKYNNTKRLRSDQPLLHPKSGLDCMTHVMCKPLILTGKTLRTARFWSIQEMSTPDRGTVAVLRGKEVRDV